MQRTLTVIAAAVLAFTLSAGAPTDARAQANGQIGVSIGFPPLIILYYFSNLDVTITEAALASYLTNGAGPAFDEGNVSVTLTHTAGTSFDEQDAAISPAPLSGSMTDAFVVIRNAWAVRSVGRAAGGDTQVSMQSIDTATLSGSAGGTMNMDGVAVRLAGDTGTGALNVTWAPLGVSTPQFGDVVIELDMSNATTEGTYSGGQFTIEATNL